MWGGSGLKLLFIAPLALWAFCLLAATLVFFPRRFLLNPYDPEEAERIIGQALAEKHRLLMVALGLLVISLGWLAAAWVYLDIYVAK